ncbi:uncharacterized protein LOC131003815 [Salvia miltiorrhiza]|uniref:uncharacterized protein LOC131003815 n=1 Tax=Salvia miltiorrhiza TaxID=226208 RepID=UPI0025ACC471|nr:uncharacterized protein LOC131003815 [Salvia miltiorrhiza]
MTIPVTNPVVSEIPLSTANPSSLPSSTVASSGAHTLMSMEEVVAMIRRLEARFNEREDKGRAQQPPPPPDPDPPYGMPPGWRAPSWIPGGSTASLPEPSYTYSPAVVTPYSAPSSFAVPGARVGFRHPSRFPPSQSVLPVPPSSSHDQSTWDLPPSQQPSTWDLPASSPAFEQSGHRYNSAATGSDSSRLFRMEPPIFDGSEAQSWVTRIQYYFDHIKMPENQRLHYVVMLFAPPTTEWIFSYRANNPRVSWSQFLEDVRRRFDVNYFVDYRELIAKLTQTGSVSDYNKEFERMMSHIHGVSESMLLSIYLGGLRHSVKVQVRFQHPTSVAAAMAIASEFEGVSDRGTAPGRRQWPNREIRPAGGVGPSSTPTEQPPSAPPPSGSRSRDYSKLPVVRLTAAEKAEKTRLGLCWFCSEKWASGHVCKGRFLAYIGSDDEDEAETTPVEPATSSAEVITADLSHLYHMDGRTRVAAMEFRGFLGKADVRILVDTGSTHNFVHPRVAEKVELPLKEIRSFRVYVGNGESLVCSNMASKVELRIQGHALPLDLHVLPIHGPDVILGMAWLSSLHRVTSDYDAGLLEFHHNGRLVRLRVSPRSARQVSASSLASLMLHQEVVECFELVALEGESLAESEPLELPPDIPTAVRETILEHAAVFAIPTGLPPSRAFDHRIHLLPSTKPVNVRPYRYLYFQKTEIERQVREMLEAGIIRRSCSAFSSPVLLIRKKDGSFRFCIDYRALNTVTVADHFPIPTSDELFDELGAARLFTKLDLRSGYHQIRMHEEDIYKTAFRTHDGHFEFLVMPFGLTNAPSTFQAAMNDIFRPLLRRFVIVFFDDILIYSRTVPEHAEHLREVFSILHRHHFYIKLSKCSFCCDSVEYLGHIIADGNLKADPSKIEAMVAWPRPTNVRKLRGFLGLTGYYRRFIAGYAMIATPLTDLLKKEAFVWSSEAEQAFQALKSAMTSAPILRLPDFSKTFYVETDASDFGVGAVLLQEAHPIAFFSKKLGPRRRVTSTYHKELYAIVEAVQKWRQYLLGSEFVIRSDQKSLRELLQQVIQTPDQQLYIRKLMGYKFRIEYKSGATNKVADALSRRDEAEMGDGEAETLLLAVAHPLPEILEILRADVRTNGELMELMGQIQEGQAPAGYRVADGLIYRGRQLVVASSSAAKPALLYEHHATPSAGHPGVERTLRRLASTFYWAGMRSDVKKFVASCVDCQTTKYSTQKPGGLLQPLPIPMQVWEDVSMDFVTGLPQSRGFTAIMVVVDRLSKYAHFAPLPTSFDAWRVANLFVETVVKHHGFPNSIVTDRDSVFLNEVWENMMKLSGTKLKFTTAYHPQSDGQTEVCNRGLEQYLRVFVADRPTRWTNFLPWAELALNCSHHAGLGTSPFQALYGREPPALVAVSPPSTCPPAVADVIRQRGELLVWLRKNLERAQQSMRDSANKHRRHVEFEVGDRVAYRLSLPEGSKIHDVFHVSLLRPYVEGGATAVSEFPSFFARGRVVSRPIKWTATRRVWRNGVAVEEGRLLWDDDNGRVPSWEPLEVISRRFPTLILEDKDSVNVGGVDTCDVSSKEDGNPRLEEVQRQEERQPEFVTYETNETSEASRGEEGRMSRPQRRVRKPRKYEDFIPHR